jgi:hypothetical protein
MASPLEEAHPNTSLWVRSRGWIEIGRDEHSQSFIRALDEGGIVWEGDRQYASLDDALRDLEAGLSEWVA